LKGVEEVHVEGQVGNLECVMDDGHRIPPHELGRALRVLNAMPKSIGR